MALKYRYALTVLSLCLLRLTSTAAVEDRFLVWPPARSITAEAGARPLGAAPLAVELDARGDARVRA